MLKQKNLPTINFDTLPKTVAIVGSRSFDDSKAAAKQIAKTIESFVKLTPSDTCIVSGGARGVDTYAVDAAKKYKRPFYIELPDEAVAIPRRFYERNKRLVEYVHARNGLLVAFADENDMRGTTNALKYAAELQLPRIVYRFGRMPLRIMEVDTHDLDVLQ